MSTPENKLGAWCPYCGHQWATCPTKHVFKCPHCYAVALPGKSQVIEHVKAPAQEKP